MQTASREVVNGSCREENNRAAITEIAGGGREAVAGESVAAKSKQKQSLGLRLGEGVGQPVEALVQAVASRGATSLDIPLAVIQLVEAWILQR